MASLTQRNLFTVLFLIFTFALSSQYAEAKKFGSSKSFGKYYQTAPSQPKKSFTDSTNKSSSTTNNVQQKSSKKGLLGGLFGGLLAGGLIAALLGGAFEGLQLMDILLFAGLAFILFKLFKGKRPQIPQQQPLTNSGPQTHTAFERADNDFASNNANTQQRAPLFDFNDHQEKNSANNTGFATNNDIPFNLPVGFDTNAFLQGAREHYKTLQLAWNTNNFELIQTYVSPELYNLLKEERATLSSEQHTEVMFVDAEIVRAEHTPSLTEISIKFSGRYRDTVEGVEEDINDVWHLERNMEQQDSPWYIVGIQA